MATLEEILHGLKSRARPDVISGMAHYGISTRARLGVSVPDLRQMAKNLRRNHPLALALWDTGIPEAKILATMIVDPPQLTDEQMELWVSGIDSWDVCDQACMNAFEKSPLGWQKVLDWSEREEEFVKRAAFALIACFAWHDKQASDTQFIEVLPLIKRGATDGRNYVKKAVNWALRNIGKRNANLNRAALKAAREIQRLDSKTAQWIASDAIRELESEAVQSKLAKPAK